jgi:prolipoprotein diacylglyceryl transferase
MEFQQEVIVLGNQLQIRYYGIIIVIAMLVAAWVAARLAKRDGRDPDHIWGALTWAIIPAIVGARLWFILFPPVSLTAGCGSADPGAICRDTAWFFQNFFNVQDGAIAIWSGGLHIFGAIIGGLLGGYLYFSRLHNPIARFFNRVFSFWPIFLIIIGVVVAALGYNSQTTWAIVVGVIIALLGVASFVPRVRQVMVRVFGGDQPGPSFPEEGMPIAPWLDIAAVAMPLGQAIGRWANYVNQELYGGVTTLPWGITIDADKRVPPYQSPVDYPVSSTLFHPLFLYESLWNILAFIVLLNVYLRYRKRLLPGDIALLWVAQYSFIRFLLEFLRLEVALVGGVNIVQLICVIAFILSIGFFLYRHRGGAVTTSTGQQASGTQA